MRVAVTTVAEFIGDRGEAHPDIICQNPAATLTETVNGGCALQEKGSLVNCVKVKNTHSVTDRSLKRSTYVVT